MDFLTAEEAAAASQEVYEQKQEEYYSKIIFYLSEKINEAINDGRTSIIVDRHIPLEVKKRLYDAGYRIEEEAANWIFKKVTRIYWSK